MAAVVDKFTFTEGMAPVSATGLDAAPFPVRGNDTATVDPPTLDPPLDAGMDELKESCFWTAPEML